MIVFEAKVDDLGVNCIRRDIRHFICGLEVIMVVGGGGGFLEGKERYHCEI